MQATITIAMLWIVNSDALSCLDLLPSPGDFDTRLLVALHGDHTTTPPSCTMTPPVM